MSDGSVTTVERPKANAPSLSPASPATTHPETAPQLLPNRNRGASKGVASHFWLTHADQTILAFLAFLMLGLLGVYWVRLSNWGRAPVEIDRQSSQPFTFRLNANSATWVEWSQLDGIGDALARRIVADRRENGPFRSLDDLRRVKGIGPKTLARLRPWIKIGSDSTAGPDVADRRP